MEVLASRRSALMAREADLQRRIRELGSLPADAFEKYKGKGKKVGRRSAPQGLTLRGRWSCMLDTKIWRSALPAHQDVNTLSAGHSSSEQPLIIRLVIIWLSHAGAAQAAGEGCRRSGQVSGSA